LSERCLCGAACVPGAKSALGGGDHTLAFQYGFACPTRDSLLAVADEWSVSNAEGILNQVTTAVGTFSETASKLRVRAGKSLEAVRTDIQQRLTLIRGARAR